jgi:hypothetical protein
VRPLVRHSTIALKQPCTAGMTFPELDLMPRLTGHFPVNVPPACKSWQR